MQETSLPESCPVCAAQAIRFVFDCRDHSISGEVFKIWECKDCSHRFTFPTPQPPDMGRYYGASHYISHSDTSEGFINKLYKIARRYTLSGKRSFIQSQTGLASAQLLDVGSGTGAFLNEMEQSGWRVTGLEPDLQARQKTFELYGLQVKESSEFFDLSPGHFNVITLWHVLEHVPDLPGYMLQFGKLLKDTGLVFIAVPNYTSSDATHYKDDWAAYDVPRHLHHFSPKSMEVLAERYGFRIIRRKPMWLDAFYISLLSEQYIHGRNRWVMSFLQGFITLCKTAANLERCSSIIYVLKKANG